MLIVPAKNVTLVSATGGNNGSAESERFRLPEFGNYVEVAVKVHTLYSTGTASAQLAVTVRGSQDGVSFYNEIGPETITSVGTAAFGGEIYSAFVEFGWTFNQSGGSTTDFGVVTFDVHAKFSDASP